MILPLLRALNIKHGYAKILAIKTSLSESSKSKVWFSQTPTVIVSTDCANQAEELDDPAEAILHLKNKHTRQDLGENRGNHSIII